MKKKTLAKIILGWGILGFFTYGILNIGPGMFPGGAMMNEPMEEEIAFQIMPEPGDEFVSESDPFVTGADRVTAEQPAPLYYAPAPVAAVSNPILSEGVLISLITTIGAILNTLLLRKKQKST